MVLFMSMRTLLAALGVAALAGCRVPEHRQEFYTNGTLKERFWVYDRSGREVMHGLYVAYYPNGYRAMEILYQDGNEVTKTYYTERGTIQGTVNVATLPEP